MKRTLDQIKSPSPPKKIYTFKQALAITAIDLHEIQDWTRNSDRAYFKPTQPGRGQGTRQGFAFKDLFVLSLIRFLKIVHIRQNLVLDIIKAINSPGVQKYLIDYSEFNFLDESCLLKIEPTLEDKKFSEDIKFLEIRSNLIWQSKKFGNEKSNFTIMKKKYLYSNYHGGRDHEFFSIISKEDYFLYQIDLTFITEYLKEKLDIK